MAWEFRVQQQAKSGNTALYRQEVQGHGITILTASNKVMEELKNQGL